MKLKLLSTAIAATFLAGCSSSGSSSNPPAAQDGIADVTYFQGENLDAARVVGDEGNYNALIIRDISSENGETTTLVLIDGNLYHIEDGVVTDNDHNEIGHIENQGDQIVFNGVVNGEKVEVTLTVVDGRLIADSVVIETPPKWGDEGASSIKLIPVDGKTLIFVGDELIGSVSDDGYVIKDGQIVGEFKGSSDEGTVTLYNGTSLNYSVSTETTIVTVHKDGMIYTWDSATGDTNVSIDGDTDNGWGLTDPDYGVGFEFEMVDDNKLVVTLGASEVTITDTATGVIISGDEGRSTVSVKTVNAYKEAMTHLTKEEQKFLALAFIANEGAGAINEDMRVKAWTVTKEMTKEWSQDNKLTMLKIANIEMDLQGNSLGYYLLTGEKKTVDELRTAAKGAISDAVNDWIPAKPNLTAEQKAELKQKVQSLSQEQRQQIKQAVKDRVSRG
nr:hypothetical protein [Vibrio cyclitrophicus]